jgi:hypothetical protein
MCEGKDCRKDETTQCRECERYLCKGCLKTDNCPESYDHRHTDQVVTFKSNVKAKAK